MAIDLAQERAISFNEAAAYLPVDSRPSTTTWWRWATRGVNGVRLETIKIGRQRCTTEQAMQRFVAALSAADGPSVQNARTPRERDSAVARASQQLKEAGV